MNFFAKLLLGGGDTPLTDPFVALHFKLNIVDSIRANMLTISDKSLDEMVRVACSVETGQRAINPMNPNAKKTADSLAFQPNNRSNSQNQPKGKANKPRQGNAQSNQPVVNQKGQCYQCGCHTHYKRNCPELNKGSANSRRAPQANQNNAPPQAAQYMHSTEPLPTHYAVSPPANPMQSYLTHLPQHSAHGPTTSLQPNYSNSVPWSNPPPPPEQQQSNSQRQ